MQITSYLNNSYRNFSPASNPLSFKGGFKSTKYGKYYSKNDIKDIKVEEEPLKKGIKKGLDNANLSKDDYRLFEKMAQTVGYKAISYAQEYTDKQKTLDEILEAYNKAAINMMIAKAYPFGLMNNELLDNETTVQKFKTQSGVEESYFDMLYDLVKDEKLSPSVLEGLSKQNSISRRTREDLDKLYEAYINNEDIVEKFVPKFENEEQALSSLPIGEVCQIGENEHISIKTKDDKIEDLFLTPETYFELFPPIERFATCQNEQGDCYLLASVDSIYQNPSTRHLVLRLFKENPDNTVDVVWRGWDDWDGKVFSVIPEDFALKDIQKQFEKEKWNNSRKLSKTCEAFRAIEILNAQSAILQSKQAAKTRAEDIENLNKFNFGDKVTLSKKERRMFSKLARQEDNSLVLLKQRDFPIFIDKQETKKLYKQLQNENDFMSEYTKLVIERLLPYFNDDKEEDYRLSSNEILPLEVIEKLTNESFSSPLDFY